MGLQVKTLNRKAAEEACNGNLQGTSEDTWLKQGTRFNVLEGIML